MRVIVRPVGIIRFLCTPGQEAPLSVHKEPCRIGPGLCELRRTPLLETVWKVRLISLVGSQESSKGSQEGSFGHLTGHRMRPPEHSSDFPDSLSRETVWKILMSTERDSTRLRKGSERCISGRFSATSTYTRESPGLFQTVSPRTSVNRAKRRAGATMPGPFNSAYTESWARRSDRA